MANKYKKGQLPYEFIAIPKEIILSDEWQNLPPSVMRMAIDLMAQYTGKNNGRLSPSWTALQKHGWKSETTVIKAKRGLLECSFVVHTRQGHAPHTTDWVAFTWWKLDWEKSMDIEPRGLPYLNFVKLAMPSPSKTLPALQKLQDKPRKQPSRPTEAAVMDPALAPA